VGGQKLGLELAVVWVVPRRPRAQGHPNPTQRSGPTRSCLDHRAGWPGDRRVQVRVCSASVLTKKDGQPSGSRPVGGDRAERVPGGCRPMVDKRTLAMGPAPACGDRLGVARLPGLML